MKFRLRDADWTLRLFLTAFLLVLTIGYMIGLFFVEHQTAFSPAGVEVQMLGNEHLAEADEMRFAKSRNEMYIFLHNHILSLALVFASVGGIFYFTSVPGVRLKAFLLVEPLIAIVTTFGGIALVRFVNPAFSWLVIVSGVSLFVCYVVMVGLILWELWITSRTSG